MTPDESRKCRPHIALLMMCKNESKRILVTLNSVVGHVDSFVIYDTGSTDNTIEMVKSFSDKHSIPLHLKEGVFENFAASRNVSLDFADTFTEIDYLLLMDVNDELRGGDELRVFAQEYIDKPKTAFLVCQEWWSGKCSKYYNMRFIKARTGWRFVGRVHEWPVNKKMEEENDHANDIRIDDKVVLFQDRTLDDDKTGKRFSRDKVLLSEDHIDNPTETRTVFYLAQTCTCLEQLDDAFYYYKLRTTMIGFYEERYESFYKCGDLSCKLGHDWGESMGWYLKAFELIPRVEPLLKIAHHYKDKKQWELSFSFVDLACRLVYPTHCVLFVDKRAYDYERWSLMGIVGWYSGHFADGKSACVRALQCLPNSHMDKNNLKFYEDRDEKKNEETSQKITTKDEFINKKMQELSQQNPRQSRSQIYTRAKILWKVESRKNA